MAESIEQILNRINSGNQYGTYGEGSISAGLQELKRLQEQFRAGNLSATELSRISQAVVPQIKNKINQLAGGGSSSANAAWAAGGQEALGIAKDFDTISASRDILGRDITPSELDAIRPYWEGGDTIGRAYLTQLKQQEDANPANLRKRAGGYANQVTNAFQTVLGRAPTQQEIEHYGAGFASGDLDEYTLQNFIQQTPEFRTAEDKRFREGLNSEIGAYDQEAFGKAKEDILSRYTKAGIQNSPALDYALTNLAGDIAKERGRYLAGVSAEQYGGNKQLARSDYETNLNRYLSNQDYNRDIRQNTINDYLTRGREVSDYNRQNQDYLKMLESVRQPRSKPTWLDYLNTGANVGRAVASFKTGGLS